MLGSTCRIDPVTHRSFPDPIDHVYAHETHLQAHQTQLQLQRPDGRDSLSHQRYEARDEQQQLELLALREQQRRARQPGLEARIPDHRDASGNADSYI
ncbi:hypothetical protein Tco_0305129 [Tanacetum coccineum]